MIRARARAPCATIRLPWARPMRAWLPDTRVTGPERATERDVEALNRVFAEAFTDRYRRDGLVGVRVPQLNPLVWRYALLDAGEGAMVWRDEHDNIAAFNVAHPAGGDGGLDAAILWHSAQLADSRTRDEVRVLKLAARSDAAFDAAIAAVEAAAAKAGIRRVAVRCQSRYGEAFRRLVSRGYRVRWTDLRMTFEGHPERPAREGGLFYKWGL